MAEDSKKAGSFPFSSTGLLALALAVFGLIWSGPSAFIAERPGTKTAANTYKGRIQDIDARLWQDPLGAIQKDAKKSNNDHSPKNTIHRVFEKKHKDDRARFLMLGVMLSGGPYPEQEEERRRKRYAVLSALDTLDYTPQEQELIGYFKTSPAPDKPDGIRIPETVPFEVFAKKKETPNSPKLKVIILWLNDSYMDRDIRNSIAEIFSQALPKSENRPSRRNIRFSVIGPNKSMHLRRLIRQIDEGGAAEEIEFFAAEATAAPARIYRDNPDRKNDDENLCKDKEKSCAENRVKYYPRKDLWRTINNDGAISKALVQELKHRQIKQEYGDHVLLISEWDTLYGRSFPQTFIDAYFGKDPETEDANNQKEMNNPPKCSPLTNHGNNPEDLVYCVNYMKGIDGLLPDDSSKTESTPDNQNKSDLMQVNNNIDRPSGNNQKDYLRRLVDQIRKLDRDLMHSTLPCPVRNNGISAIGVVGSDVFDKLMILQALRPYFPGKIFFTTDLDAAYFSPQELPFTHNLIVGSSFGLTLAPELQKTIPPFRDSYQTAVFFSTKLATAKWSSNQNRAREEDDEAKIFAHIGKWLKEPRVFEIGRKGPIDLSTTPSDKSDNSENILGYAHIHPDSDIDSDRGTTAPVKFLMLSSLILGLLLLYRVSWTFRWLPNGIKEWLERKHDLNPSSKSEPKSPASRRKIVRTWSGRRAAIFSMVPLVLAGSLVVVSIYLLITKLGADEPFYWGNGVSIWPSNLLTSLSILLSIWFFFRLRRQLEDLDKTLGDYFCLNSPESQPRDVRALAVNAWEHGSSDGTRINVVELWVDYLTYGMRSARLWRTALNTLIFVLFGVTAIMLSGGLPVPARGNSFYIDVIIEIACVIAVVFLIMWIVDVARLFSRFIHLLADDRMSDWPNACAEKWGWPPKYADYSAYWIDVQFVAQYTKSIEKFIWYPVIPLLLIGAARSQVFDNWTFSPGLLVSIAILLLYLFSIAFLLQYGAKEMRTKAVTRLEGETRKLRSQTEPDAKKIEQLERMTSEIKNNMEGAFTPFLQQPMVQALLAFLSGSGGLLLLLDNFF